MSDKIELSKINKRIDINNYALLKTEMTIVNGKYNMNMAIIAILSSNLFTNDQKVHFITYCEELSKISPIYKYINIVQFDSDYNSYIYYVQITNNDSSHMYIQVPTTLNLNYNPVLFDSNYYYYRHNNEYTILPISISYYVKRYPLTLTINSAIKIFTTLNLMSTIYIGSTYYNPYPLINPFLICYGFLELFGYIHVNPIFVNTLLLTLNYKLISNI
jgi:hypothetical protein